MHFTIFRKNVSSLHSHEEVCRESLGAVSDFLVWQIVTDEFAKKAYKSRSKRNLMEEAKDKKEGNRQLRAKD